MLIKYYSTSGDVIIMDNVQDVRINPNPAFGDFALDPWQVFEFDNIEQNCAPPQRPSKVITFAKDGPCVLYVWNVAYVCNDDGKTIEKVWGELEKGCDQKIPPSK